MALPAVLPPYVLPADTELCRIHWKGTLEPFFGPKPGDPPKGRFDDPAGSFRVCYLGEGAEASFVETYLRKPPVRLITREDLSLRLIDTLIVRRNLRLLPLYGPGLAVAGVTAAITSSPPPYVDPQAFSREVWQHPDEFDGIRYLCRHDNQSFALALFHRAYDALEIVQSESLLLDTTRLLKWKNAYGFEIG